MRKAYLALLRGINVGGKNKLSMKDLAELFIAAGYANVRTFIQSGNVVFDAEADGIAEIAVVIQEQIATRFGFSVPIILRTPIQMQSVLRGNPFLVEEGEQGNVHVVFLADKPSTAAVARLDPQRSPGDRFEVRGSNIYLHLPNGLARSKLTNAYFDSKLATIGTVRNWRTITALTELLTNSSLPHAGEKK